MQSYKTLDHTADIGIEVSGKTRKKLFENAVEAMFDLMVETKAIKPLHKKQITIKGTDAADTLINLLREALYLFYGEGMLWKKCTISELSSKKAVARLAGERYDADKHKIKMEIKAVTYHSLFVGKIDKGWRAKVIFDV